MKLAKGPRPWSINLFAVILTAHGLWGYIESLSQLTDIVSIFSRDLPWIDWNHDLSIVALSAIFTIVLIPVAAVWGFASKIARVILTVFAAFALVQVFALAYVLYAGTPMDWVVIVDSLITPIAVALLYTRSAGHWLTHRGKRDAETFA